MRALRAVFGFLVRVLLLPFHRYVAVAGVAAVGLAYLSYAAHPLVGGNKVLQWLVAITALSAAVHLLRAARAQKEAVRAAVAAVIAPLRNQLEAAYTEIRTLRVRLEDAGINPDTGDAKTDDTDGDANAGNAPPVTL